MRRKDEDERYGDLADEAKHGPAPRKIVDNGRKPVRIEKTWDCLGRPYVARVFIGDDEFPHPIAPDSVGVSLGPDKRHNLLTVTLLVGDVSIVEQPSE